MKYSIDTATDTITFFLPNGETVEIPKSDPAWSEIIEVIFGGVGSEGELTRCIADFRERQKGSYTESVVSGDGPGTGRRR